MPPPVIKDSAAGRSSTAVHIHAVAHQAGLRLLHGLLDANPVVPPKFQTAAMPSERGARLLRMPNDVDLPQLLLGSATLFIRYFYDDCINGPMANFDARGNPEHRRFIVFGNPGG